VNTKFSSAGGVLSAAARGGFEADLRNNAAAALYHRLGVIDGAEESP